MTDVTGNTVPFWLQVIEETGPSRPFILSHYMHRQAVRNYIEENNWSHGTNVRCRTVCTVAVLKTTK